MLDIGWSELLVIAVVAIVVVGPKDLPKLMRSFGHYAGKLRRAASDFQRQFDEAMRESELDEVRKTIESARTESSSLDLNAPLDKPIMVATPKGPQGAKGAAKPKRAVKRPRKRTASKTKRAASKTKKPAKRAKTGRTRRS
jgi:sec-independent protein translocase protein TatB